MPERTMLSEHFALEEFACDCCGLSVPHPDLMSGLEKLRIILNRQIKISCGTRCKNHNKCVSEYPLTSYHLQDKDRKGSSSRDGYSRAADIKVVGLPPNEVAPVAQTIFNGVGLYDTFVHVDIRSYKSYWNNSTKFSGSKKIKETLDKILDKET